MVGINKSKKNNKPNIKKLNKTVQKHIIRLAKKNKKMIELNKIKNIKISEIDSLRSKCKDYEYLLQEKEKELIKLTNMFEEKYSSKIKNLETERNLFKEKYDELKEDIAKKETTIELLQTADYDYQDIVFLDIEKIKTNWLGWPEGANLEELDLIIKNNSPEMLKNVVVDIYLENAKGLLFKYENYPIIFNFKSKAKISRKIVLFKQIKKRGIYKVIVKLYIENHSKELVTKTQVFEI